MSATMEIQRQKILLIMLLAIDKINHRSHLKKQQKVQVLPTLWSFAV
jgi:hypothetical protein